MPGSFGPAMRMPSAWPRNRPSAAAKPSRSAGANGSRRGLGAGGSPPRRDARARRCRASASGVPGRTSSRTGFCAGTRRRSADAPRYWRTFSSGGSACLDQLLIAVLSGVAEMLARLKSSTARLTPQRHGAIARDAGPAVARGHSLARQRSGGSDKMHHRLARPLGERARPVDLRRFGELRQDRCDGARVPRIGAAVADHLFNVEAFRRRLLGAHADPGEYGRRYQPAPLDIREPADRGIRGDRRVALHDATGGGDGRGGGRAAAIRPRACSARPCRLRDLGGALVGRSRLGRRLGGSRHTAVLRDLLDPDASLAGPA